METKIFVVRSEEKSPVWRPRRDEMIILKLTLTEKSVRECGLLSLGSGQGPVVCYFEDDSEP